MHTGLVLGPTDGDDAPEIVYDTPTLGGFELGPSSTPNGNGNGANIASTKVDGFEDWVEAGLTWRGEFAGIGLQAAAVAGRPQPNFDNGNDDDPKTIFAGLRIDAFRISFAGGIGTEKVAGIDRDRYNLGIKRQIGPMALSAGCGQAGLDPGPDPENLVLEVPSSGSSRV